MPRAQLLLSDEQLFLHESLRPKHKAQQVGDIVADHSREAYPRNRVSNRRTGEAWTTKPAESNQFVQPPEEQIAKEHS